MGFATIEINLVILKKVKNKRNPSKYFRLQTIITTEIFYLSFLNKIDFKSLASKSNFFLHIFWQTAAKNVKI